MAEKKKKIDYAALSSPFMRIPKMRVAAARALMDLGVKEVYELRGRDPESLLADYQKLTKKKPDSELLHYFKVAVDIAEEE